jgi:arylsulfatase A-like enzyme
VMDPHDRYSPPPPYDELYDPDYHGKSFVEYGEASPYHEDQLYGKPVDLDSRDVRPFIAMYDGEIRYADAALARLWGCLKSEGLLDKTLVVVTSDHGEEFYDHGGLKHNHTLYNELISIPVIFYYEGALPPGAVLDGEILQAIDTVPTILDYAGIPKPSVMQGESVRALLGRGDATWRDYALSENLFVNAKAFISNGWKYIHHFGAEVGYCKRYTEGCELYNVADDPEERHNLYAAFPDKVRHLQTRMMAVLPVSERKRMGEKVTVKLDKSARQRLRTLGYVQ